jgi:pantoate--beta-alanine ligase
VTSIFVNPTQFGPGEDYAVYPRDLRRDRALCKEIGVDVIFVPGTKHVYPEPSMTRVSVPALQSRLCGASRPTHFDGVCLIVTKLLNMTLPHELYLGQKDAQQAIVLGRLARDLSIDVKVRVMPTVRERDGLAMSSRNDYLTPSERAYAPRLYQALQLGRRLVLDGERRAGRVRTAMRRHLAGGPGRIDYLEIVDADSLEKVTDIRGDALLALAVYVGKARLIDNVRVRLPRARRRSS